MAITGHKCLFKNKSNELFQNQLKLMGQFFFYAKNSSGGIEILSASALPIIVKFPLEVRFDLIAVQYKLRHSTL